MFGGYKGWYNNTSVTSVTIPDTRTIAYGAFYNCSSLTDIVIPDRLTEIASRAFYDCSSLTSIVIPDTVKKIGSAAFYGCKGLKEVTLPISAEYHADVGSGSSGNLYSSFYACENVKKITYTVGDGTVFAPGNSFTLSYYARSALATVEYEEGITEISEYALYGRGDGCRQVTAVTLPSTVKKIGASAFRGCSGLRSVYYNGGRNDWNAIAIGANNDSLLAAKLYSLVSGDINGSGAEPDVSDLQCLYTYLSKREAVGAYQDDLDLFLSMADVNGDGAVNILDYQRLYMALTGAAPLS